MSLVDEAYQDWIKKSLGVQYDPRLSIKILGVDERGIECNSVISKNTTLASVPFESLLTIESAKQVDCFRSIISKCREDDILALLLLYEMDNQQESKWSLHLKALPKTYHSIVNFVDDELEWILGSNLYSIAVRWKQQIEEDYEVLYELLDEEKGPAKKALLPLLSHNRYLWALSTIWSRFITIVKDDVQLRAMVPFVDFLNHHPLAEVGHQFQCSNNTFFLFTAQSQEAHKEMYLNYGHVPNARLLMLYGFTLQENPYASVDIWISVDTYASSRYVDRVAALEALGLSFTTQSFALTEGNLPSTLLTFLRVQHCNELELTQAKSEKSIFSRPLSSGTEAQIRDILKKAIKGMIAGYPTSLEEDEERLKELKLEYEGEDGFVHPMHHEYHAKVLVYSEKKILHSILPLVE